ncbi:hypothetical protein Ae717Ps2_6109c [Pseudonocardia sp. Ae717_Ps2]|nr:hypothetical protein Ae717Ps2_6797c [Pseudonocardia sp. Ae717_Ps2]OLM28790.1 hypothetical protein Ae717Ps2_6109c [Pseudonocardia sp. Ae717_Ps2]
MRSTTASHDPGETVTLTTTRTSDICYSNSGIRYRHNPQNCLTAIMQ